jgi:hypothetical protein
MIKQKFEILKKIFSAGEVTGYKIRVVNTPRFLVEVGDKNIWLDGKYGLENRRDGNNDWVLRNLREKLTTSEIGESFAYIGVDKVTAMSENQTLHLNLSHYGVESYKGFLTANRLANHIALSESNNQSPEAIIGLETIKQNRIIFNFVGSKPCLDKKDYDRVLEGKLALIYLNSNTGEYLAEKTHACNALYAPLAHIAAMDITDEDLVKAMGFAPTEVIYRA